MWLCCLSNGGIGSGNYINKVSSKAFVTTGGYLGKPSTIGLTKAIAITRGASLEGPVIAWPLLRRYWLFCTS
jgi:hypothetical protein